MDLLLGAKVRREVAPLVAQLKALEQAGLLEVWDDTRIDAGDKWYPEIEEAMKRAAVVLRNEADSYEQVFFHCGCS